MRVNIESETSIMITTLVLISRMPKKLIAAPFPPPPPPNDGAPPAPNDVPAPPALIMVRGAVSDVLISGRGGKVTFDRPVVYAFWDCGRGADRCHFLLQLNAMLERAFAWIG